MTAGVYLRNLARESRGSRGRMVFFVVCLAVGVAAVVAVAGLSAGLSQTLRAEARQLLAADLVVAGRKPLPAPIEDLLAGVEGAEIARVRETVTMASVPGASGVPGSSRLVEIKAVEGGYPFYGRLELEPDRPLAELLAGDSVVIHRDLVPALGLGPGDPLRIGNKVLTVTGLVSAEPDRIDGMFRLGPRVFVSAATFEASGLESFGSRIDRRTLVRLPEGSAAEVADALAERLRTALADPAFFRVETFSEAQPALRQGVGRVERFLGLVALLSLLVAGLGVAQTARAWLAGRLDAIAVYRCLGLSPREVTLLYLGQTAILAAAGSLLGAALGLGLVWTVPRLAADLLPATPPSAWQPLAALRGLALGSGVSVAFCLPPLFAAGRVPPVRVLRRDAEPLPADAALRWVAGTALAVVVWATAAAQSGSLLRGLAFAGGLGLAAGALAVASTGLVRAVGRLPRQAVGLALRYGLAALGRPGAGTVTATVSLGLGMLVVLAMSVVEGRLVEELRRSLPPDAPSVFLIDIQPDQWRELEATLAAEGATEVSSVPVITTRLAALDGRPVIELADQEGADETRRDRWALTREQRLTWLDELPDDNTIVAGTLWGDPEVNEISVERDFASELGVGLGSVMTFDIQGVELSLTVTSLRTVEWQSFGINFFLVAEPSAVAGAPATRLAAARLPREREQQVQDHLAAAFPNVTLFRVREILEKVAGVLERLGLGVRFLGLFTVAAGLLILAGAVSATAVRRAREVALLKTLGMTRSGVVACFAVECALIGLVAGSLGAVGASVLAWAVLTYGMEVSWGLLPARLAAGVAAAVALTVAAGLAASRGALVRRPVEVLRD